MEAKVLNETHFNFPGQTNFYRGKVREIYTVGDKLIMITSDRLSAFDVVMPRQIPYKGQVLNQIALRMLNLTRDICPNWLLLSLDPNVMVGHICEPIKIEMVVRGYCSGHAWRTYRTKNRLLCGIVMAEGLREDDKFPSPIVTPTLKSDTGDHDQDISPREIIEKRIVSERDYKQMEDYALSLFERGSEIASDRGLILADTKYEFGKTPDGKIVLIDEIHTPDSSRYFYKSTYRERQNQEKSQTQLSKEFVRQWLMENGFQGKKGEKIPDWTDEKVSEISAYYIKLYEEIVGERFIRRDTSNISDRIYSNVIDFLSNQ